MIPWEPLGCDYLATIWQHLHFHMAMFQPWLQKMTLYPSLADSGSQSGSCWRAGGNRVTRRQSGVVGRLQEPNAAPRRQRAGNNPGSNPPSSRQPFYCSLRTLHLSELSNCGICVGLCPKVINKIPSALLEKIRPQALKIVSLNQIGFRIDQKGLELD